jgi:hypothetical protein
MSQKAPNYTPKMQFRTARHEASNIKITTKIELLRRYYAAIASKKLVIIHFFNTFAIQP